MSDSNEKNIPGQINIDLPEEVAGGEYSNLSVISHSPSEFVIDFVQLMPGVPKGKVKSRILMTPDNAKKLLMALKDNIGKYESNFGPIKDFGQAGHTIPMNFGGPNTEA